MFCLAGCFLEHDTLGVCPSSYTVEMSPHCWHTVLCDTLRVSKILHEPDWPYLAAPLAVDLSRSKIGIELIALTPY
jgi:hypothetical protein